MSSHSWQSPIFKHHRVRGCLLAVCLATVLSFSLPQTSYACGIVWGKAPMERHFDGVDNKGNVSISEKMGEMETLGGFRLPFYAVFNSESENRSPYAGFGWSVPLLESRIVPIDEKYYRIFQPDGCQYLFWRDKKNPNLLRAGNGWTAEMQGDTITAKCPCPKDGNKMVFKKGRLVSLEVKQGKFEFVYDSDRVAEIREGSKTVLKVEKNTPTGIVIGLTLLNKRKIGLERCQRRIVQVDNKKRKLGGSAESLGKIIRSDGTSQIFEYGVDEKLNPMMKLPNTKILRNEAKPETPPDAPKGAEWRTFGNELVNDDATKKNQAQDTSRKMAMLDDEGDCLTETGVDIGVTTKAEAAAGDQNRRSGVPPLPCGEVPHPPFRELVWDASTKKIIRDGDWTYTVTPPSDKQPWNNAAIARTNTQNQKEFWHRDKVKGEEITEGIDGVRSIVTWFTSGKLRGMLRKMVEIKDGVQTIRQECSYNEKGQLMRLRKGMQDTFYVYEEDGRLAAMVRNGVIIRSYTDNGNLLAKKYVE